MNNFLYSPVDNLTCNLYNTSCKNCIACVDCKTGKNCVIKERCSVLWIYWFMRKTKGKIITSKRKIL